jgi:uncharacterized phage protein (TIGR01671 family)
MREIKFRAWNPEEKTMLKPFDLSSNPKYWCDNLKDYPLMQFTGLKDKNKVEIYENDVIDYYGKEIIVKIPDVYIEVHKNLNTEWCEVIGNLYETPELLDNK